MKEVKLGGVMYTDAIAIETYLLKEIIQAHREAPEEDVPTEIRMRYKGRTYAVLISGGWPFLQWLTRKDPPLGPGEFEPVEDWGPEEYDTIEEAIVGPMLAILDLTKHKE